MHMVVCADIGGGWGCVHITFKLSPRFFCQISMHGFHFMHMVVCADIGGGVGVCILLLNYHLVFFAKFL